ncbi:MAG TPA: aldo/keto reductase [Marmoricola sp.]|jgi:aryl-alcohol dehydrogenase-like predicted oxidoreductase|nr:aldo/keto reductase [Marmoricola sp.]
MMEQRKIGGLTVSAVGLGCNNFAKKLDEADSAAVVHAALDAGVTLFDTSDRYGDGDHPWSGRGRSEEFLGKALGKRREDVVVATKFGNPMSDNPLDRGGSRRWVTIAVENSLRRLGTDYIDLYQIHRPDPETPVEETLEVLGDLVQAGKVREAGCSNFTAPQLREAASAGEGAGRAPFRSLQNEYSLLRREIEDEVLGLCAEHGIGILPYFPLASGLLTGKYRDGTIPAGSRLDFWAPRSHFNVDEATLSHVDALTRFAEERDRSLLELSMSWLAGQDQVASVIAGATSPEQVRANVVAASWTLSRDDRAALDALQLGAASDA